MGGHYLVYFKVARVIAVFKSKDQGPSSAVSGVQEESVGENAGGNGGGFEGWFRSRSTKFWYMTTKEVFK